MKKILLILMIPLQLFACAGCVFTSLHEKLYDLFETLQSEEYTEVFDLCDLSPECAKYYLVGRRDSYCDCIKDLKDHLFISHDRDQSCSKIKASNSE